MGTFARNLRYAVRTLVRSPGFTVLVVATLALGIGANTAMFSIVDAVLLRDLPYAEPDRLVTVWQDATVRGGSSREGVNAALYRDLRDEPGLLLSVAVWSAWRPTLTGVEEPVVIEAADVSHEMFGEVLRVRPRLGRDFIAADDVAGAPGVVLLGHRAWRERFGADPDIVGRSVSLSGLPYVVVGVLPEGVAPPSCPMPSCGGRSGRARHSAASGDAPTSGHSPGWTAG